MKKGLQQQQAILHMLNVAKNPRPRIVKQKPKIELPEEPIIEEYIPEESTIEDKIEEKKPTEIKENKKQK